MRGSNNRPDPRPVPGNGRKRDSLSKNALGKQLLPQAVALLDQSKEIEDLLNGKSGFGSLAVGATLTIGNYLATLLRDTD